MCQDLNFPRKGLSNDYRGLCFYYDWQIQFGYKEGERIIETKSPFRNFLLRQDMGDPFWPTASR